MEITAKMVKDLRDRTGAGMMDCKKALKEAGGNFEKAVEILRKMGMAAAAKRAGRTAAQGRIESYIHPGNQIGVLLEVNSETDFVAKTDEFKEFCREVAMHIAAMAPLAVSREDLDPEVLQKEKEIYLEQVKNSGKPEQVWEKIVEGKMKKFYTEACLLEQPWVRNDKMTIEDLRKEVAGKLGENIVIRRFVRFRVGEGS